MPNLAPAAATPLDLAGSNLVLVYAVLAIAVIALVFGLFFRRQVLATDPGTENMQTIGAAVEEGAQAYLNRQFRTLSIFVVLVFGLLFLLPADTFGLKLGRSAFFVVGAVFSALIGYLGMSLAVKANVRVASAARDGNRDLGMRIAFRTGGTVGMATVGLGLLGAAVVVLVYKGDAPKVLEGFGFGAALLAMFMRVGGGIFTKAADVGADLVGKVEAGIPEDDPRNAATIADNVGDNVGDCAGMAADLFESYAVTLVAALILGSVALGTEGLIFPLIIPAIGAVTAIIGVFITRVKPGPERAARDQPGLLHLGGHLRRPVGHRRLPLPADRVTPSTVDAATGAAVAGVDGLRIRAAAAVILGIVLAGDHPLAHRPLHRHRQAPDARRRPHLAHRRRHRDPRRHRRRASSPPSTPRSSSGRRSTERSCSVAARSRWRCSSWRWPVPVCSPPSASSSRWTPSGRSPTTPRASPRCPATSTPRARGSSPTSTPSATPPRRSPRASPSPPRCWRRPPCSARSRTRGARRSRTSLDTNQIIEAPSQFVQDMFNTQIVTPSTLVGLLLGAAVVFLFSGLAINAVTRAAGAIVFEVRRQFREHPGIMDYTEKPEYGRVVDICTRDSLRELATPGLLAALAPVAVGFGLGIGALAGFLAGAIGTGCLMAVFLANSGGSWDNAKKIVEDGHYGGKGSAAHEATVIGDTVGDPFKDTAGPAINPLAQGHEPGVGAHRPGHRDPDRRQRRQPAGPLRHRRRRADHHRRRGGRLPVPRHLVRWRRRRLRRRSRSTATSSRRPEATRTSPVADETESRAVAPGRTRSSPGSDCRPHRHAGPTRHRVGPASSPPAYGVGVPPPESTTADTTAVAATPPGLRGRAGGPETDLGVRPTRWTGSARSSAGRGRRAPPGAAAGRRPRHPRGRREPAAVLARCFALGMPVSTADLDRALPGLTAAGAGALGLVELGCRRRAGDVRPAALRRRGPRLVGRLGPVRDRPRRPAAAGPRPRRRAGLDDRRPVDSAPPRGTGPRPRHRLRGPGPAPRRSRGKVVATDLSAARPRLRPLHDGARRGARSTCGPGSLLDPVAGERFDLVVSNPPFVITPRRAGGRDLRVPRRRPGRRRRGRAPGPHGRRPSRTRRRRPVHRQLGDPRAARPGATSGRRGSTVPASTPGWCSATTRTRPSTPSSGPGTPAPRSGTPGYEDLYAAWLADFAARGVERIGFGVVALQRPIASARPTWTDLVDHRGPVADAMGPSVDAGTAGSHLAGRARRRRPARRRLVVRPGRHRGAARATRRGRPGGHPAPAGRRPGPDASGSTRSAPDWSASATEPSPRGRRSGPSRPCSTSRRRP